MRITQLIRVISLLLAAITVTTPQAAENDLMIYCGITMVRPVTELARTFEQRHGTKITISQGGSEDLYQSLKKSQRGDLYFPGEPSYRTKYLSEGLLGDFQLVGYNQVALFVAKGNPKNVKPDLKELLRKDVSVIVGSVDSGSIGQETKRILDAQKLFPRVIAKAALMMPDSRAINLAFKRGEGDLALNWRATAFFPENQPHLQVVDLPPSISQPQALLLIQLTFSKNPKLAQQFANFAASEEGQAVFRKFGFLDNKTKI